MTGPEQPIITTMTPGTIREVVAVSDRIYHEELRICGIPESNIVKHFEDFHMAQRWYMQELTEWADRPEAYHMRRVVIDKETAGLLTATLSEYGFDGAKYVDTIQLDHRIRRQGVGSSLLKGLIEFDDPAKPIYLHVLARNGPAHSFYDRAGFRDTGMRETIDFGGFEAERKLLVKEQKK